MRTDKELAFTLRKQGKSYKEIHKKLGMSVSTLSNWFKGVDFSEAIKHSLIEQNILKGSKHLKSLNAARGDLLRAYYEQAENEALTELRDNINNPLFVAAVSSYWGEGDKLSKNHVRMTNTDPSMILLFKEFLIQFCCIPDEKMRIALFIYEDLDDTECKKYWSNYLNITHFHKTQVLPSRHKSRRLPYGICTLVVSSAYLKKKMTTWIDHLPEMVLNMVSSDTK